MPPAPCSSPLSSPRSETYNLHLSGQQCTFTPKISKKALRAWERRPATPFAPRSESHKIWKRCEQRLDQKRATGDTESWRTIKRMRTGKARRGDEDGDRHGAAAFIGTRYDDLGDMESKRPRKLVAGVSRQGPRICANEDQTKRDLVGGPNTTAPSSRTSKVSDEPRLAASRRPEDNEDGAATAVENEQQIVPLAAPATNEEKPSGGRIDSTLDESFSPQNQSSIVAEVDERPVAERNQVEGKQQFLNAPDRASPAEKRIAAGSCKKAPLSGDEAVGVVPKISFALEGDDTEYLHAFLTRAKAKRAARTMTSAQSQAGTGKQRTTASSPQTRSRTALATLDSNSPSPKKIIKPDVQAEELGQNGVVPDLKTTSPLRKSSRKRQSRPQAHQAATPSSISFRRSNGTEFVFLQKTEAQQIATATKSNTRKNKGESLQPKMKLETLSSAAPPSPVKAARRKKNGKQVSWDEGLACFAAKVGQPLNPAEEQREAQTPVKRSSRLAGGKGTPAPKKKMAEAAMPIATPASTTRARTRGRA